MHFDARAIILVVVLLTELETRCRSLFFCKLLTFCACFSTLVACLTSRCAFANRPSH